MLSEIQERLTFFYLDSNTRSRVFQTIMMSTMLWKATEPLLYPCFALIEERGTYRRMRSIFINVLVCTTRSHITDYINFSPLHRIYARTLSLKYQLKII